MSDIVLRQAKVGNYDNNVYVLVDPETNESILIDTPDEPDVIERLTEGTKVRAIVFTHGDMDHLQAFSEMDRRLGAPVLIHTADAPRLPRKPDRLIDDGDIVELVEARCASVIHPDIRPAVFPRHGRHSDQRRHAVPRWSRQHETARWRLRRHHSRHSRQTFHPPR